MKIQNTTITLSGTVLGLILAGDGVQAQNLYVGSYGNANIVKFSGSSTPATFATGMNYPTGLAFDCSGDLFEGDQFSGNIYEWAGAGMKRTTFASGLSQPGPMAFNAAGDLFVIVGGQVNEFSPAGTLINTIGFSTAKGLAFDCAGNLYVSDPKDQEARAGVIVKITPEGVQSTFASGLNNPGGIAFDRAGYLFVTDEAPFNAITEITPGGSKSTFASDLNQPFALAFDAAGNLFVADAGVDHENGDITEIADNGTESVVNTSVTKPVSLAFEGVTKTQKQHGH